MPVEWAGGPGAEPVLAALVLASAADPRSRDQAAFAIEAVLEGFLCHQGRARLFGPADGDVALLAGDLLYALGLRAVASAGETDSVEVLADLIGAAAGLAAEGRTGALAALWTAQAIALGDDPGVVPERLLTELIDGSDPDGARLLEGASARTSAVGADGALNRAFDALQSLFEVTTGTR